MTKAKTGMFWVWFNDLYKESFGFMQPCPECLLWPAKNCGYLWPDSHGDCNCEAPDSHVLMNDCDSCHHTVCGYCSKKERDSVLINGRFIIYPGSKSCHCCFEATVMDSTKPERIGGKIYKDSKGRKHYETICECFSMEDAVRVAAALNNPKE